MRILILLLFIFFFCQEKDIHTVVRCLDGDTVQLEDGTRIRIYEIDAPERTELYGKEAKEFAEKELLGKRVTIIKHGTSYNRIVAEVFINGHSFAEDIVGAGLAHINLKYCHNQALIDKYIYCKSHKIGLFSQPYILPYQFRKLNKY